MSNEERNREIQRAARERQNQAAQKAWDERDARIEKSRQEDDAARRRWLDQVAKQPHYVHEWNTPPKKNTISASMDTISRPVPTSNSSGSSIQELSQLFAIIGLFVAAAYAIFAQHLTAVEVAGRGIAGLIIGGLAGAALTIIGIVLEWAFVAVIWLLKVVFYIAIAAGVIWLIWFFFRK
jgi:hypothetical protein